MDLLGLEITCLRATRVENGAFIKVSISDMKETINENDMYKVYILGVKIKWTTYVPNQNNYRTLYIDSETKTIKCNKISDCENFNDVVFLKVHPEYSYNISVAYYTKVNR